MPDTAEASPGELNDPYVKSDDELGKLLAEAPWRRFLVAGDSVAKGVGEPTPGYRQATWGERMAAVLERAQPELRYLNLGTPEQTAAEIRGTQLDRAREFAPDLAAYVGGGNDLLVEQFDVEAVGATVDETVRALAETGAVVITFSMFDLPSAFGYEGMEELSRRLRLLNDAIAEISERHRTLHVDLYSLPCCSERDLYSSDLKHGSMRGQAIVASVTLDLLAEWLRGDRGAQR